MPSFLFSRRKVQVVCPQIAAIFLSLTENNRAEVRGNSPSVVGNRPSSSHMSMGIAGELMKKDELGDELRPEYDLSMLRVRKLGRGRKSFGDVIRLEPDVAGAFPDADAVNEALRFLIRVMKENRNDLRSQNHDS